jgi:TetR/AcrR family transcriptional regulator
LFKRILQRGIDSGEFKAFDVDSAVLGLVSVVVFLSMWKHSLGACTAQMSFEPTRFLKHHVDTLMHGWLSS